MKKLLVLGGEKTLKELTQTIEDIYTHELTLASFPTLEFIIDGPQTKVIANNVDITEYDFVWIQGNWKCRPLAHAVSVFLTHANIPHTPVEHEGSKLSDILHLSLSGVQVPKTYHAHTSRLQQRLESIVSHCSYPFVMKSIGGHKGSDMFLVSNATEFEDVFQNIKRNVKYVCQSFVPNSFDYRIIVCQGRALSANTRTRQTGEYRNNVSLGADEVFIDIDKAPEKVRNMARLATQYLGLQWTGVDIVTSSESGENYLLEVNRGPGLTSDSAEVQAALAHIHHLLTPEV